MLRGKLMMKPLIGAALFAAAAGQAHAATFVFEAGNGAIFPSETIVAGFDDPADDAAITGSNFRFLTSTSGDGSLPAAGDGSRYLSVLAGGEASFDFAQPVRGFSVDLGSLDSYNKLSVRFVGGDTQSFTGDDIVVNANGDQAADRTNGRFRLAGDAGQLIAGVTFSSGGNSFEADRIAVTAVPEPAMWAMMISGFGLIGYASRRSRTPRTTLA